ncbi:MAG: PilZ domain-containing protein [Candidatus Sulfotelmatobacter sp.]
MPYFPPPDARRRAPRTSFAEATPAVLRFQNGRRVSGKLQVISLTGGLLCLSRPLDQGSRVKLMFLTGRGSVLGAAEMLSPISWSLQPFKFVGLYDDDQQKLQAAIQSSLDQNRHDHGQVERHRAW